MESTDCKIVIVSDIIFRQKSMWHAQATVLSGGRIRNQNILQPQHFR